MTRTAPVYRVKWTSQIVRSNTRLGPPTPAPNAVSNAQRISTLSECCVVYCIMRLLAIVFLLCQKRPIFEMD